nr:uncharacterized protein LOC123768571 [Procambarus clarkii]
MAAKNKSHRKRSRDCVEIHEKNQEHPVIIANIKRRRKTRVGSKTVNENKSTTAILLVNSVANKSDCNTTRSIVTLRRHSNSNSCWEHSTSTSAVFSVPSANIEQNLTNNIKKTYASRNKHMQVKNDKGKPKQNSKSKSSLCDLSNKEDRFMNAIEDTKIKEENVSKSADNNMEGSAFPVEGGFIHKVKVGIPARADGPRQGDSFHSGNCALQIVGKDAWKSENDCTAYITSDWSSESKKLISKVTVNEDVKANESDTTTGSSDVLAALSSNVHLTCVCESLPTSLQSVNNLGVSLASCRSSLTAGTSTITAITSPITTYPLVSDKAGDAAGGAVFAFSLSNSLTKQEDNSPGVVSSASYASSSHNILNHDVSNPKCNMISVDKNELSISTVNCNVDGLEDHKNIQHEHHMVDKSTSTIPIVQIDDDGDLLSTENYNFPVSFVNCSPATSMSELGTTSASPIVASSRQDHSPNFMQVDNWAATLLQRLQLLYESEQECDLLLKFATGETLKVHRAIVSACTSLVSDPHPVQQGELHVPSDLNYASVEPVIRFVYSGRLDVRGSHNEMSAIYAAAQRLQVPLLTRFMDRRFPYLSPSNHFKTRLPIWKRSPEKLLQHKQQTGKGSSCTPSSRSLLLSFAPLTEHQRSATSVESSPGSKETGEADTKDSTEDSSMALEVDEEVGKENEGQDGSVYFLLTNSQKIAEANAAVRRKRPAEEARPTRFELEEDAENVPVHIVNWSSKNSSFSPSLATASVCSQDSNSSSCSYSPTETSSFNPLDISLFGSSRSSLFASRYNQSLNLNSDTRSFTVSNLNSPPQDPFSLLTQVMSEDQVEVAKTEETGNKVDVSVTTNSKSFKEQAMVIDDPDTIEDDDIEKDGVELMEKISSICKQLEEKDVDEAGSSGRDVYVPCDYKMETEDCEIPVKDNYSKVSFSTSIEGDNSSDSKDSFMFSNPSVPVKSILKKKKDKTITSNLKKHVSFPLDENNELINEVALYSHAKEPAQSLIEVQKTVGTFKPSDNSYSPSKLTLSLKQKVLMNLNMNDSEATESCSQVDERGKSTKDDGSASQSTSHGQVNKGDMSNHAKIISEVLKKYPQLVKDKKNIRLKILKKGSDKAGGGKLVKSKVQYLVLSDGDSKTKLCTKLSKTITSSGSKGNLNTLPHAVQNAQMFECPECEDIVFPTYFTFKKHVSSEHKDKSSAILASIDNVPYACYTCFFNEPLEFSDYFSYQQHMKEVHSKNETRLCSMCGFRPGRKLELAYHQYTEHNKVPRNITFPKCDLCDHVAMNDAALLKHRSQHANADNYTCSVCGGAFCSFGALQGHMQTKLCQNKPNICHKCPHCPLTFARSYNLKAHCKSSHRAKQKTEQIAPELTREETRNNKQEELSIETGEAVKLSESNLSSHLEQDQLNVEGVCETLTSMNSQSSSEAEALSTVANSLAASLGLPEETINHFMYTQVDKLDFPSSLSDEKYEESIERPSCTSVHLVEDNTSVSGYQGELPLCHDRTYTSQAPMPSTASVGNLYPVGVVPSHIVSSHLVPGQIVPNQMLEGGCVSTTGGSVLGTTSHSWTYVTYEVPNTTNDLPALIAEATTLNSAAITQDQSSGTVARNQEKANMACDKGSRVNVTATGRLSNTSNDIENVCEQNPLLVMANTATQADISRDSDVHAYLV